VGELYGLLDDCLGKMYGVDVKKPEPEEEEEEDIEAAINKEVAELKASKEDKPALSIKLDIQCLVFFRLKPPCIPTDVVYELCKGTADGSMRKTVVQRLTPVTRTAKGTLEGLEALAKDVLKSHFHEGQQGVKYAIRPTTRNHNVLKRDKIISTVASIVGQGHKVDLKNYDLLILVDFYTNICGMSVVKDWDKYHGFNLAQIQAVKREKQQELEKSAGTNEIEQPIKVVEEQKQKKEK